MLGYDEYLMAVSRGRGRQIAGLHAHKVGPAHTHRVPLDVAVPLYKIDRRRHAPRRRAVHCHRAPTCVRAPLKNIKAKSAGILAHFLTTRLDLM